MIKYFKHKIRRLIFKSLVVLLPKHRHTEDDNVGITTLLHHDAVDMFLYSLSSLFYFLGRNLSIFAVEDGSITTRDKKKISRYFNITFLDKSSADRKIKKITSKYTNFLKYRLADTSDVTKRKFDAILLSPFHKFLYIEPDILFFRRPEEIIKWFNENSDKFLYLKHDRKLLDSNNREDLDYSYRQLLNEEKFRMTDVNFNSGLLGISTANKINLNMLDNVFKYFNRNGYAKTHCSEETALSIVFKDVRNKKLSGLQYICPTRIDEYLSGLTVQTKMIHYIYETKTFFERDAIKLMLKYNCFIQHNC